MIKRLRRTFVAILMGTVAVILAAVFGTVIYSTWSDLDRGGTQALEMALRSHQGDFGGPSAPDGPVPPEQLPEAPMMRRMPTLVICFDAEDEPLWVDNQISFLEADPIGHIAAELGALPSGQGTLRSYDLRYLKAETPDGSLVALVDTSMERAVLGNLLLSSLGIGAAALLLFFVISLLLSRWAVRPVERAWTQQKQFVADASHELKTPLTVILSNAELLEQESALSEKSARRLGHIREESLRMKRLTEDLLTLARADAAKEAAVFAPVDLSQLVRGGTLMFEAAAYERDVTLEQALPGQVMVSGDEQALRRLVGILLDNALKYTPPQGRIAVRLSTDGRRGARLSIQNSGEPIPASELRHIFRRFYRLDKARMNHGGFGLGLSIAERIVREHGGRIWAESGAEGNTFFVELPLA